MRENHRSGLPKSLCESQGVVFIIKQNGDSISSFKDAIRDRTQSSRVTAGAGTAGESEVLQVVFNLAV